MLRFASRYTHVPLAVASVVLLLAAITWLLVRRMEGWDSPWSLGAPAPGVVTLPATPPDAAPVVPDRRRTPSGRSPAARPASTRDPGGRVPGAVERYVLESGPYASPDGADEVEDRLSRLGHATVRFRKQDDHRLYVVTLSGFASREEATEATRLLGRGTVVDGAEPAEVVVSRLPSLGDAVAAARPLRARGFEVHVTEALAPTVIYHLRYGRFEKRADAQALHDELVRSGIRSRVVLVQTPPGQSR